MKQKRGLGVMISGIAGDDEGESPQGNICDMKWKMSKG